ncbi:MAG TPA: hypothetical protein PKM58_12525 [Pyrinomonadaceae bacterium]|nr:hypothetical protein [Pyrinomonadaceae bacterium]
MRELFVILIVAAVLLLLTAIRYRRQIFAVIRFWRTMRAMKSGPASGGGSQIPPKRDPADVELVRCSHCNAWKPRAESLKFSRGNFYCSSECVNAAMNVR